MTVGLSAANYANKALDVLGNTTFTGIASVYVKLHTGDPGTGASNASAETTRKLLSWSAASAGSKSISASVSWTSWAAGSETISHISLWDASTAGNFLGSAQLSASKSVANSDTLTLSSLSISLTPIAA